MTLICRPLFAACALSLLCLLVGCQHPPAAADWTPLFDGQTTAGWRDFQGDAVSPESWRVEDGCLVSQPTPGDIITLDRYADFELAFEWRVTDGANSGVFFRVDEAGDWLHHTGVEYQVLDNLGQPDRPGTEQAGACYGLYPPAQDATRPTGEWNHARLIVRGDHVTHTLNGVVLMEYDIGSSDWDQRVAQSPLRHHPGLGKTRAGHIALQNYHGHRAAFRNLRIRPAPSHSDPAALGSASASAPR